MLTGKMTATYLLKCKYRVKERSGYGFSHVLRYFKIFQVGKVSARFSNWKTSVMVVEEVVFFVIYNMRISRANVEYLNILFDHFLFFI